VPAPCSTLAFEDEFGGLDGQQARATRAAAAAAAIPADAKFQLTLAAINTLFRILHTIQDRARAVWDAGGAELVKRIVLLASHMQDSFEEAATKLLVVFFSHRYVQEAVREAGARALPPRTGCRLAALRCMGATACVQCRSCCRMLNRRLRQPADDIVQS
jgi:hypothetical protein